MKGKLSLAIAFVLAVTVVMLLSSTATAEDYEGWEEIRPALIDGDGAEFVKPIPYLASDEFSAATEFEAVKAAAEGRA